VLLLLTPVLLVVLAGLLVDHRLRSSEAAAVERCATGAEEAIHAVREKVAGTIAYVRPVWAYKTPPTVRRGLAHMVSKSATGTGSTLADDRRRCAAVQVVAVHQDLRLRRAACLRLLDRYVTFLQAVVEEGTRGFGPWPEHDPGCWQ